MNDPHLGQPVVLTGAPLDQARAAMILVHGRGATAESILLLARELTMWRAPQVRPLQDVAFLAPQAAGNTWYPYSFLSPIAQNEPGITSGLASLARTLAQVEAAGIPAERTVLLGFSQGACLTTEFVARHPRRYGGVVGLSGGLIGPPGLTRHDVGDLAGTPVFLGCSDVDPHIPKARVEESAQVFRALSGDVTMRLYRGMDHTVNADELDFVRAMLDRLLQG